MNALNTALQQTQTTTKETLLSLPHQLKAQLPLSTKLAQQIADQRQTIQNILEGKDHRLMIVTGPCSIHDPFLHLNMLKNYNNYKAKSQIKFSSLCVHILKNHVLRLVGKVFYMTQI